MIQDSPSCLRDAPALSPPIVRGRFLDVLLALDPVIRTSVSVAPFCCPSALTCLPVTDKHPHTSALGWGVCVGGWWGAGAFRAHGYSTVAIRSVWCCSDGRPSGAPFHLHRWPRLAHTASSHKFWLLRNVSFRVFQGFLQPQADLLTSTVWFPSNVDLI